jgi:sporulation protein YlmC with PRC-barrel domain
MKAYLFHAAAFLFAAFSAAAQVPPPPQPRPEPVDPATGMPTGNSQIEGVTVVGLSARQTLASRFLDRPVQAENGTEIGRITNLLINRPNNSVDLVVITRNEAGADRPRQVAIPLSTLLLGGVPAHPIIGFVHTFDIESGALPLVANGDQLPDFLSVRRVLLARPIITSDGKTAGTVQDLVFDGSEGTVAAVLVDLDRSSYERPGSAQAPRAVAWSKLTMDVPGLTEPGRAIPVKMTQAEVWDAPSFFNKAPEPQDPGAPVPPPPESGTRPTLDLGSSFTPPPSRRIEGR